MTDDPDQISELIKNAQGAGAEIILVSGGMSVDPDDKTPEGIRRSGAKVESHGFPILPGSMFVMAYLNETPVLGLSGCVLHDPFTAFDILLPRLLAGEKISRADIMTLGHGGLQKNTTITEIEDGRWRIEDSHPRLGRKLLWTFYELQRTLRPRMAALLVVDVQNDFVSPEGSAGKRGEDVSAALAMVPNLLRLINEARRVGLTVVYIRTTHSEWTDTPSWIYRSSQKSGLNTCREGTWGAEFYDGIAPLPSERVVIKHRYSAFINTDLNTVLKARNIQSVLVCGVATNVCVETTARDAYIYDYYVTMIDDCSAAYEAKLHLGTLENMQRHFGLVASSTEIIETWKGLEKQAVGL